MSPDTPIRGLPLAVLDVETTGLDPAVDQVVSVAVVHAAFGSDDVRLVLHERVKPTIPIPASATAIHGLTDADVADAPPWSEVQARVVAACAGRVVCAYNAPFDHGFVAGLPWPWLCFLVAARAVNRYQTKLADVSARYGIALDAHGAAGDALAAALVGRRLYRSAAPPAETLGDLLLWQQRTAVAQEREFVAYRARVAPHGPRPDCPWHEMAGEDPPAWPERRPTMRLRQDGTVETVGPESAR